MAFTYDPSLPLDQDKVRLALGDTDGSVPLLQDEEIAAILASYGSVLESAAALAESLAARFARQVNISVDGLSKQYSDLSKNYAALAERLRARAEQETGGIGAPVISGVSVSDMLGVDQNTDRVPSQFKIGQFDSPPTEGGGNAGSGGVYSPGEPNGQ